MMQPGNVSDLMIVALQTEGCLNFCFQFFNNTSTFYLLSLGSCHIMYAFLLSFSCENSLNFRIGQC